ncbi:MAG: LacI family DNA-binding transcriptional regulator, partial [Burkholderiales bacterium]|nr:LacI family DNA-binding transcriptional regulator [Burkholderiales bacterium]
TMTVSRALSAPGKVDKETLEKVRWAIEQTSYVPNMVAGGLKSRKSRLVAAVVPTLISPVFNETVQSLTETFNAAGYQLILGQSGYEDSCESELVDALIARRPAGIVLTGVIHADDVSRRLVGSGIPVVETWDLTATPIDSLVGFSHEEAARSVCRFLHQRGRRKLAVLAGDDARAKRRTAAFVATAIEVGLQAPRVHEVPAPATLGSGRRGLRSLMGTDGDLDGLFCSSDLLALGVITEANVMGLGIPGRLSLVGFGDLSFASDLEPALTTVRIDGTRIGREAARCIVDRAENDAAAARLIDVGFSIVERASA